jgi:hypothetical protein
MSIGRLSLKIPLKKINRNVPIQEKQVFRDVPPLSGVGEIEHHVCRGKRDALSFSRRAAS